MKLNGLDGREYKITLSDYEADPQRDCSSLHKRARALLARLYPADRVLEEVFLPGCGTPLRCDFYLPLRRLMVEVQGEQHYQHVVHFVGPDHLDFLRSQQRDRKKKEFAELNNISHVELPFNESDDEWSERIMQATGNIV